LVFMGFIDIGVYEFHWHWCLWVLLTLVFVSFIDIGVYGFLIFTAFIW